MNTPSHAVLNLALLSQLQPTPIALPIALGAVLPDLPIFACYFWAKVMRRQPEHQIWSETYYQPFWQTFVAFFHSIPLALLGSAIAHFCAWPTLELISLSMVLHSLFDLPVHNDDAHRHFFPFSNYRFISPLSYWDPKHHGAIVSLIEKLLVLIASIYVFSGLQSAIAQGLLIAVNLFYVATTLYFRFVKPQLLATESVPSSSDRA